MEVGELKKTIPAQDATLLVAIAATPITTLQEPKGNKIISEIYLLMRR